MPEIVPAEFLDTGALERLVPSFRADLLHRVSIVREHMQRVPSNLPADDFHGTRIERHGNRLSGLRLVGVNPSLLAC
jgi:hypothetical protein